MSPQSATIHPAPLYARRSRIVTVKPVGAFVSEASCESERCVFAMQIGSRSSPVALNWVILSRAVFKRKMPSAP